MMRGRAKSFVGPEDRLHCMVLQYIHTAYPRWVVVHPANEGKRSWFEIRKAKMLGLVSGVSDLLIFAPQGRTLALELKAEGKKPSQHQSDFLNKMVSLGYSATWCDNFDSAMTIIDTHSRYICSNCGGAIHGNEIGHHPGC